LEEELLAGARRVFGRLGYSEASVEDILLEAGVSRHSFYRLFLSKADVYQKLEKMKGMAAKLYRAWRARTPMTLRAGVGVPRVDRRHGTLLACHGKPADFRRPADPRAQAHRRPRGRHRRARGEIVFGALDPALVMR
jgi:AcrR family transcriptional regulator